MVDALVSFAVQKLDDFLRQQARLRFNLKKDLQNLETQLRFMQAFLKDAEEKQVEDHSVQLWVFEIKSLADDAVAILETYNFVAGEGDGHGFASRLKTCACICRKETKFCSDNSFSQLEFLHLTHLEKLERWHLAASAMPLIKGLRIDNCPKLKEIPQRMKEVERFEEIL